MPFGRDYGFWCQALRNGELPTRLCALRVFAGTGLLVASDLVGPGGASGGTSPGGGALGTCAPPGRGLSGGVFPRTAPTVDSEEETLEALAGSEHLSLAERVRVLLEYASPSLGYPLIWALARCDCPALLGQGPPTGPARAARFLSLRRRHRVNWRKKANLQRCLSAIAQTAQPLRALACCVRLLELHRDKAIPGLLQWIQRDQHADLCAWALGQLGLVTPILQSFAEATPKVRYSLAMAVWYMGASASAAIPTLLEDGSSASMAALLAMEERASLRVIAARRLPVWLDDAAVDQLAQLAFDVDPRVRHYAAEALSGFGPAAPRAVPILRQMLRSNDVAAYLPLDDRPELQEEFQAFKSRNLP